jgi:hypothetical protein
LSKRGVRSEISAVRNLVCTIEANTRPQQIVSPAW